MDALIALALAPEARWLSRFRLFWAWSFRKTAAQFAL